MSIWSPTIACFDTFTGMSSRHIDIDMEVSSNRATPKSSILIGFMIFHEINHPAMEVPPHLWKPLYDSDMSCVVPNRWQDLQLLKTFDDSIKDICEEMRSYGLVDGSTKRDLHGLI